MIPPSMGEEIEEQMQQQIFDDLFGRFRSTVFRKVPHSADLNKNSDILASVFHELCSSVNGDLKISEYGMLAKEFETSAQIVLPGFTSDDLQKLFAYFDGDQDGKISVEEFVFGIKVPHIPNMHFRGPMCQYLLYEPRFLQLSLIKLRFFGDRVFRESSIPTVVVL